MECVGEIGAVLRGLEEEEEEEMERVDGGNVDHGIEAGDGRRAGGGSGVLTAELTGFKPVQKQADRHEIADSQAEDFLSSEDDNNDAEGEATSLPKQSESHATAAPRPQPPTSTSASNSTSTMPPTTPHALILLPSLPRLLSPLMHHNHVRGHALLIHLLRALRHLTTAHAACVVLLNGVVGVPATLAEQGMRPRAEIESGDGGDEDEEGNRQAIARGFERERPQSRHLSISASASAFNAAADTDAVSIFASNGAMRPALGKTFAWGLDVSLMVSVVGGSGGRQGVRVVEVVSDRFEGRAGRWCEIG